MLPIERESAKAEREAAVAAAQRASAAGELLKTERRMGELQVRRVGLERELAKDENQSGVSRQNILNQLSETADEAQGVGTLQQQARRSVYDAAKSEAGARQRAGMGAVQKLQAEAGGLEEDAAQAAGGARQLGGMNRYARANAVQSLQLLQQFGPDLLSPQQLAQAQSIAPRTAGKILEQFGKGTSEYADLQRLAPADFAGDPDDLRRCADGKLAEAAKRELELERDAARAVREAGADVGKYLADVIRQLASEIKKQIDVKKLQEKGSSN